MNDIWFRLLVKFEDFYANKRAKVLKEYTNLITNRFKNPTISEDTAKQLDKRIDDLEKKLKALKSKDEKIIALLNRETNITNNESDRSSKGEN